MSNLMQPADLSQLTDDGIVLEMNRQFLHPLGLCATVKADASGVNRLVIVKSDAKSGISYRDDSLEQMKELVEEKLSKFNIFKERCHTEREGELGYVVQPI